MEKKEQEQAEDRDIKFYFENNFLNRRVEFIEDYDFENDKKNYKYFESFILNFEITKNDWYNTLIIDLADKLCIVNNKLYHRYLQYLSYKSHYLFKLSILDYFINNSSFYKEIYHSEDFDEIYKMKSVRYIVKNQIVINNLVFFPENKSVYIKELLRNMNQTTDYRSHIRVYNYIMNFELEEMFNEKDLKDLIKISLSKKFGRAVDLKLQEFKDYMKF